MVCRPPQGHGIDAKVPQVAWDAIECGSVVPCDRRSPQLLGLVVENALLWDFLPSSILHQEHSLHENKGA
eukprot:3251636-Pyramimonas_sp.AAC.1